MDRSTHVNDNDKEKAISPPPPTTTHTQEIILNLIIADLCTDPVSCILPIEGKTTLSIFISFYIKYNYTMSYGQELCLDYYGLHFEKILVEFIQYLSCLWSFYEDIVQISE